MNLLSKLNPDVGSLIAYEPGKPIEEVARELGLDPKTIIKLASNESALETSPKAVAAIQQNANQVHLYPDGGAYRLKAALSEHYDLTPENFIIGNGSNEILELIGHCFLNPSRSAVFSQYAFIVYKLVSKLFGARMIEVDATESLGHDLNAIRDAVDDDTSVIFLCNPNNPTGTILDPDDIISFIDSLPDDILVVIDEAYIELCSKPMPDLMPYLRANKPVLISRTFSKAYGLAGLRLGYGIACPELISAINKSRQPFNCNLIAQEAAIAALSDQNFIKAGKSHNADCSEYFESQCQELSFDYIPTATNFMLIKTGDSVGTFQKLQKIHLIGVFWHAQSNGGHNFGV